jgi:hypothetical protein
MTPNAELSWSDAKRYFSSFEPGPWADAHQPLLDLIDGIEQQELKSELFVRSGLSGLWISDHAHNPFGGHMLHIQPRGEFIHFSCERTPYATDGMEKTVKRVDAVESLREFLVCKFGVYRKPEAKNA